MYNQHRFLKVYIIKFSLLFFLMNLVIIIKILSNLSLFVFWLFDIPMSLPEPIGKDV